MIAERLYSEEEIVVIGDQLNSLIGKILLDDHQDIFSIKSFNIISVTVESIRLFHSNTETQQFYIEYITITDSDGNNYTHRDDMCSIDGVTTLIDYNTNYKNLYTKLNKINT